jgi:hypothetical protein
MTVLTVLIGMLLSAIWGMHWSDHTGGGEPACFSKPSACGYPDATNTGVPRGVALTPSGSRTVSTPGKVLSGLDLTGTVTVNARNVTIENSRLHRPRGGSGTSVIQLTSGADDFTIRNSEVYGGSGSDDGIESAVWNLSNNPGAVAIRSHFHDCSECWHGSGTFRDDYIVVDAGYPSSHDEDIYVCNGRVVVDHSTLYNLHRQTATIFGDTVCGGGNRLKVTRSLLAGGGFLIYSQANSDYATGRAQITDNRFARCVSRRTYHPGSGGRTCRGGRDPHGLYPLGGFFGMAASYWPGRRQVWENNVWDDNLQPVCPDGARGCRGRSRQISTDG